MRFNIQMFLMLAAIFLSQNPCDWTVAQELAKQPRAEASSDHFGNPKLEACIPARFKYVYRIGDFYILGTDERPRESDRNDRQGKEVVLQAVRLFGSFLDANEDGKVDDPKLLKSLGDNFAFAIGSDRRLRPVE